jgi:hypothetical protein
MIGDSLVHAQPCKQAEGSREVNSQLAFVGIIRFGGQ